MGASFVIALREGIEAALIVSIVLAYLRQLGATDRSRLVWWGTGLAVLLSAAAGTAIFAAGAEFDGKAEEVFEGLVTLAAVSVLTWMVFWMRRQGARIKSELQDKVDTALVTGGLALAGLAFFAVLREGIETALFLFAAAKGTAVERTEVAAATQVIGAMLGLAVAVILGALLYRGGIRMNLRSFFRVTGLLLIVETPRRRRRRRDPARARRLPRESNLARGGWVGRIPLRCRRLVPPSTEDPRSEVSTRPRDFGDILSAHGDRRIPLILR
jgi:high-affinity iron transporter